MSRNSASPNSTSKPATAASAPLSAGAADAEDLKSLRVRQKAEKLLAEKNYEQALDLLNTIPQVAEVRNLKGICFMRKNSPDRAVQVYRTYLINTDTACLRDDVDPAQIINYATALLLMGKPAGCLDVLGSLTDGQHPLAIRLHQAIRQWSRGLGLWSRFNWWLGRLEPDPCVVPIDFVPGDFQSTAPVVTKETASNSGALAQSVTQSAV